MRKTARHALRSALLATAIVLTPFVAPPAQGANADTEKTSPISPEIRALMARADEAARRGDLRVAALLLKNAVQTAPRDAGLRARLGNVLVMQGAMPEAERTLREARRMGAPDEAVLPALFQAMLAQHEAQPVLDGFPEPAAGDRSETATAILRARALAHFQLKNLDAADAAIDRALAVSRTPGNLVNKAQFLLQRGNRAGAERLVDEALKAAPKDSAALVMKVGLLERAGAYQQALAYSNRLVESAPNEPVPRVLRIELLAKLQRDKEAQADVSWLLKANPKMPIALYDQALLNARKGDIKSAWAIAQALPPEFLHSAPQFGLGAAQIAQAAGNPEIEESMLNSVISQFPGNEEARVFLAMKRLREKNPKGALAALEPVKTSSNPQVMAELAQIYRALGDKAAATSYLSKAMAAAGNGPGALQMAAQLLQGLETQAKASPGDADINGTLIVALIQAGRIADAQQVADRFAGAKPNDAMTDYFRGQIAMTKGDLDGASEKFSATLKAKRGYAPALYYRAQVSASRGDMAAANADLNEVLKANPKDAQALSKKAQFAMQAGRDAEAANLLQQAAAAQPGDVSPQITLANFYLSRRDYAKAESMAQAILDTAPENMAALSLAVRSQLGKNDIRKAVEGAGKIVKLRPDSAAANVLLGEALDRAKNNTGAVDAYQAAIKAEPANPVGYRALILHYAGLNDSGRMIATARSYVARQPGPGADLLLADTLMRAAQPAEAKATLTQSLTQKPDRATMLALVALEERSDGKAAEARLAKWVAGHGDDLDALSRLAGMQMANGNLAAGQAIMEKLVRLQPYNASYLNDLAWSLQKSDPARAIRLASLAVKVQPQSGEILDTLAWLKWQQNDRSDSLQMLRQAHALSPAEPNIAFHLAMALDASGNRREARSTLQAALKANPDFANGQEVRRLMASWK